MEWDTLSAALAIVTTVIPGVLQLLRSWLRREGEINRIEQAVKDVVERPARDQGGLGGR